MTAILPTRFSLLLASGVALAGCSFEAAAENAPLVANSCSVDGDCLQDARCNGSMCVARTVESPLRIVLDVTPVQSPDGPAPVPIAIPSFDVQDGPMIREWTLPRPVTVRGRVRNGDSVVDADVTLTASYEAAGIPTKAVTASITGVSGALPEVDFEVRVAREGDHVLLVQPKDISLPPVRRIVSIAAGEDIEVDYGQLDLEANTVKIDLVGATDDRPLVVRAVDKVTGAVISSNAPVEGSTATLRFAEAPTDYRIVVRPEGAYDQGGSSDPENVECDRDTPVLPTFSIDASNVPEVDGVLQLVLPAAPERIRYAGSVALCEGASSREALPITLRSTAVELPDAPEGWTAEVATDTQARYKESLRRYQYCVDVFPGDYVFVVTPPASEPCEIFAQSRLISAQADGQLTTGELAQLTPAAELSGTLETLDNVALAATTVDVQSLGREGVAQLHDGDPSLTAYNRSRQTTTDDQGEFSVLVDRGTYDVALKPPAGSGYAWNVRRDVTIASNELPPNSIDMALPVAIDCGIAYQDGARGDTSTLAGAEVTAYGLVTDAQGVERAIAIGKAVADTSGRFMLLLPAKIGVGLW